MMTVRKVGLLPTLRTVDVVETMTPITITMERGISLDGVTVTARRTVSRTLRDLMERRRAGIAGFWTRHGSCNSRAHRVSCA